MTILGLDFETYSEANIKNGAQPYAQHESTGVYCAVLAFAETKKSEPRVIRLRPGDRLPAGVVRHVESGLPLLAHNAGFEQAIIEHVLAPYWGWPTPKLEQWVDTGAIAAQHGLPVSLAGLCKALGTDIDKDSEGHALMMLLCKPDKRGRFFFDWPFDEQLAAVQPFEFAADMPLDAMADPEALREFVIERLIDYCEIDVLAMFDAFRRLPKQVPFERAVFECDQRVNARGVFLDQPFARAIERMATRRAEHLSKDAFAGSGDFIELGSSPVLKQFVKEHGIMLPLVQRKRADGTIVETETLDRRTAAQLISEDDTPEDVKIVLRARIEQGRLTSLAKLKRIGDLVNHDGRLRGALRYCGAHTGRWSSSGFQVHNLPKPRWGKADPAAIRQAVLTGDYDRLVELWPGPVMEALSFLLRSVVVAPPGFDLIGADFSAIEARVLAWLAGQTDVLDVFREGRDIYVEDAAKIGSDDRQLGKVQRLALGYGMGALKFASTAAGYGIDLPLKRAREVMLGWRENNPAIVSFWYEAQNIVAEASANPGTEHAIGDHLRVTCTDTVLRVILPSGRALHYWRPHQRDVIRRIETVDEDGRIVAKDVEMRELRFFTAGKGRLGMEAESTYGGKLAENFTQAVARDLLAAGVGRLERNNYDVMLHVHDSAAAYVETGTRDVDEFCEILAAVPRWAPGLPVAAEGYRSGHFEG